MTVHGLTTVIVGDTTVATIAGTAKLSYAETIGMITAGTIAARMIDMTGKTIVMMIAGITAVTTEIEIAIITETEIATEMITAIITVETTTRVVETKF
jgi:hypothetical protein